MNICFRVTAVPGGLFLRKGGVERAGGVPACA
jgi:hypothetical protein